MKKWFVVSLTVFIVLLSVTACSNGGTKNAEDTKNAASSQESQSKDTNAPENENATVIVGIKGPVLSLDPANHRDRVTESVLRNIYDNLVTTDVNGKIIPKVAESWENPTPTEWVFNIRKGIKFHDGSDLTAADVKFTFDRIITEGAIDGKTAARKGLLGPLKEVQVIDDNTVKFLLDSPWPIFLTMLPLEQIVPKAYMEKVGLKGFLEKPIGSGPFKLVQAKLDERIALERNDGYFEGAPKIKNLAFDVIPESSSRIAALTAGEVQRIHALSPTLVSQLESDKNIEVKVADGTRVYMLEMNTQKPPFDNVKVRQAMNYAIDMNSIIKQILSGYATRLAGPMLSNAFGINTDLKPYEYNPAKAKQLLQEAGYPNGFSVVIDTDANDKEVAEAAAAQLRSIGIDATSRVWDPGVLKPMMLKGERQMFMGDWGNSTMDPYDFLNPKLKTKDRGNYSLYSNPRVDELLTKGESELDPEKRKAMYKEAQQIIYDETPWVFGYSMKEIEAGVKALKGWETRPDGMLYMDKAYLEK